VPSGFLARLTFAELPPLARKRYRDQPVLMG